MSDCGICGGLGEVDASEADGGAAWFIDCRHCLGTGSIDCTACGGTGVVVVAVDCPACSDERPVRHDAAA